jgi:hypothetical protein
MNPRALTYARVQGIPLHMRWGAVAAYHDPLQVAVVGAAFFWCFLLYATVICVRAFMI